MNLMSDAPQDGQCILLLFWPRLYKNKRVKGINFNGYERTTFPKWEECRWISNEARTGSPPHWEPWCGEKNTYSSQHINNKDAIGWLPVPERGD